eukprot:CAMPEP_0177252670 /NCGR_PEP_ID=MMETSP0367-20130122/54684_1 /TAXON_ID=447022 ORGANISM="Scrippsiella hangoei-like, Strain SHHI-4" /NCGR_SAMPLE_ID=MMETSP0367 /ASSEMBLY_ACC=CAM_ASM_000362 /LENGTH=32 /DNA_ID= /DNA_START= /DNA_END= /DNA_ORIENTATION=
MTTTVRGHPLEPRMVTDVIENVTPDCAVLAAS